MCRNVLEKNINFYINEHWVVELYVLFLHFLNFFIFPKISTMRFIVIYSFITLVIDNYFHVIK